MNPEKEAGNILVGETVILAGPEIVRNATEDFGVGYEEIANTEIGGTVENVVDFTQGIAPELGVLALTWVGLKTMFKGFEDNSGKRSGLAS